MIIVWFYDAVPEGECYIGKKISTYEDFCNASTPDEIKCKFCPQNAKSIKLKVSVLNCNKVKLQCSKLYFTLKYKNSLFPYEALFIYCEFPNSRKIWCWCTGRNLCPSMCFQKG